MLAGEQRPVRQWAIKHRIAEGDFLRRPGFVPVGQARIMADTESLDEAGIVWFAKPPENQRRVRSVSPALNRDA